jgi:hypothetical protein
MASEFEKEYSLVWCEHCDQQGYIFVDNLEGSYFVTCKTCGWETSDVWCPKCGMGGQFVKNISKRPSSWNCPNCKTKYVLPAGFYEDSISLFTKEELPPIVRERLEKDFQANRLFSADNLWHNLRTYIVLMLGMIVMFVIWLLPLALVFTPLPWTIPGFIVTLLVFPAWWWLSTRMIKNVRARFTKLTS